MRCSFLFVCIPVTGGYGAPDLGQPYPDWDNRGKIIDISGLLLYTKYLFWFFECKCDALAPVRNPCVNNRLILRQGSSREKLKICTVNSTFFHVYAVLRMNLEGFSSSQMEELLDTRSSVSSHDLGLFPHHLHGTYCSPLNCKW